MSNFPPGVTDAMIDAHFGGPDSDDWGGPFRCTHEGALDAAWSRAVASNRYTDPGNDPEVARLDAAPIDLDDGDVRDVAVWHEPYSVLVQWTCRLCGAVHDEEHEPDGPDPDVDPYED